MAKLLTRRKAKWVEKRQPDLVRGNALNPSAADEVRYAAKLEAMVHRMCEDVEKDIKRLFKAPAAAEYFAMDESVAAQARILTNAMTKKFNSQFATEAKPTAEKMARAANKSSSSQVYSSIQQLSGGLSLPTLDLDSDTWDILSATITENVSLIKSISQKYLIEVQGNVMRSITNGQGLQQLVPALQKSKEITLKRARMIAHDQNRKAFNNLSIGRMKKVGLRKYEWRHTAGSKEPRKLHEHYNGMVFSFDNPPVIDERTGERGNPGQAINCRCRLMPVLEFDDD